MKYFLIFVGVLVLLWGLRILFLLGYFSKKRIQEKQKEEFEKRDN